MNPATTSLFQLQLQLRHQPITSISSSRNQGAVSPPLGNGATTVVPATPSGLARRRGAVGDPSSNPMPAPMYDSVSGPALAPGSNEPLRLSSFPYGDDPTTTAAVPPVGPGGEEPTTPTDSSAVAAVAPVGPGGKEPLRMSSTPTDPSTVAPGGFPGCPTNSKAGNQTLQLSGCPVAVYCSDSGNAYLNLRNVEDDGSQINYAQYGPSPNNQPMPTSTPTTVYSKVRFDPANLSIVINDYTYATNVPADLSFRQGTVFKYSNFSSAGDCAAGGSTGGQANINLLGTNLSVQKDQFSPQGYEAAGRVTYASNNQVVVLNGGGYCGAEAPSHGSQFVKLSVSCKK
ncbi:hypothetical protein ABBQ32_007185 [Trebouxia sp. C0010 RCD-2024]